MTSAHALGQFLRTLPASAAATFLALFPIVDPFGGGPIFFSLTSSWPAVERRRTALKTSFYVFAILVVFLFFGRFVLSFFGISLPVLKIAGGLIVANTAWGMVTLQNGRATYNMEPPVYEGTITLYVDGAGYLVMERRDE